MHWGFSAALAAAVSTISAAHAGGPPFELPIDCDMTKVCSIQKYFDLDSGPGRMDYACGRLTMDKHDGTDFRLPDFPLMEQGIAVLAAGPGVVKATRDGMADVSVREAGKSAIEGREAGNGVVIDHGDGWETQYSHLKRGSVAVKKGDRVTTGQRLGLIGLSGETEYPHVHFSVRHQGRSVDPFVGIAETFSCGDPRQPLWSQTALASISYRPSVPLVAGFATDRPEADKARHGAYAGEQLPASAPALVFWVDISGAMAGDVQRIRIDGPDGQPIHRAETTLKDSNISWFAFSGLRRPQAGWSPGVYKGTYELVRNGQPVVTIGKTVEIAG
jgi:hypothetical protein